MTIDQFNFYLPQIIGKHTYASREDFMDYIAYFMTKKTFFETIEKFNDEKDLAKYLYKSMAMYFKMDKPRIENNLGCRYMEFGVNVRILGFYDLTNEPMPAKRISITDKTPPLTGLEKALEDFTELEINEVIKAMRKKNKHERKQIFNDKFLPLVNEKQFRKYLEFKNYEN